MKKFLLLLLTGSDNSTFDIGRVMWLGSHLALTGIAAWQMLRGEHVDLMTFATAQSALLVAGAGCLRIKVATEPPAAPAAGG